MEKQQATNPVINNVGSSDPYAISKEISNEYINAWQTGGYQLAPSSSKSTPTTLLLDSFLFSIEDFNNFVTRVSKDPNVSEITGVVCRIGIKPNPFIGGTPANVPCLVFEPVINFKAPSPTFDPIPSDSVTSGTDDGDIIGLHDNNLETARYDFCYPCPPTCSALTQKN